MNEKFLTSAKILVFVGSGGVGKTTLSASIGVFAASKGLRVMILTIDPSQRLKTTLNLSDNGDVQQVPLPQASGSLWAAVLNPQKTFDDFIKRASTNKIRIEKLLHNKLYSEMTTTLAGSQEFTALEKLYSLHESGEYDLIILDTPPTKHAIDFLNSPQKLSQLFNEGVAQWFRDPEGNKRNLFVKLVQTGTRQVLKALESLTGSEFMRELGEFFVNIQSWQKQIDERISSVHALLVNPQTKFILVSQFDRAKLEESLYFAREIKKSGYHLNQIFVNRAFPLWFLKNKKWTEDQVTNPSLKEVFRRMLAFFKARKELLSQAMSRLGTGVELTCLPELSEDIHDVQGLIRLCEYLQSVDGQNLS